MKALVSDLVSSAPLEMVSSKLSSPAVAATPMAESEEKKSSHKFSHFLRDPAVSDKFASLTKQKYKLKMTTMGNVFQF